MQKSLRRHQRRPRRARIVVARRDFGGRHADCRAVLEAKQRDPEMHQTKKCYQCCFGMKAHIGADRDSSWCTVVVTARECGRHHTDGGTAVWRGDASARECGLHRRGEAGGDRVIGLAD